MRSVLGDDAREPALLDHGDGADLPVRHEPDRAVTGSPGPTVSAGTDITSDTERPPERICADAHLTRTNFAYDVPPADAVGLTAHS